MCEWKSGAEKDVCVCACGGSELLYTDDGATVGAICRTNGKRTDET
jgi:hypothetical protein